jgi:hypothetical protein
MSILQKVHVESFYNFSGPKTKTKPTKISMPVAPRFFVLLRFLGFRCFSAQRPGAIKHFKKARQKIKETMKETTFLLNVKLFSICLIRF